MLSDKKNRRGTRHHALRGGFVHAQSNTISRSLIEES